VLLKDKRGLPFLSIKDRKHQNKNVKQENENFNWKQSVYSGKDVITINKNATEQAAFYL
jgi:hypothetical protein